MNIFGDAEAKFIPLDIPEDQFQIYNEISRSYSHSFLFESLTGPGKLAETSVMGFDPKFVLKGYVDRVEISSSDNTETIYTDDLFKEIKNLLRKTKNRSYRYLGGAVGVVNYDLIRMIEDIPDSHGASDMLMEFGIYDDGILYDNIRKKLFYFYHDYNRFERFKITHNKFGRFNTDNIKSNMTEEEFSEIVKKAKRYIYDGDIFQVVLSRRFSFDVDGDNLTLYQKLRELNPSPYMYHLKQADRIIIGSSPEMLVRVTGDKVETFPIAGTTKAVQDKRENQLLAKNLLNDEKELAEHTMLVDLGRNDLGRVCRYGTVRIESFMDVKKFRHVQHIVTHVVGNLAHDKDMFDAFRSVFPAGTLSGAPKVRAMEIIDELEADSRGSYGGAVGYFSHNECCDFAIGIRSIFIDGNKGFVQSGAGIVSDSIAKNEFDETEYKAGSMLQALREAKN